MKTLQFPSPDFECWRDAPGHNCPLSSQTCFAIQHTLKTCELKLHSRSEQMACHHSRRPPAGCFHILLCSMEPAAGVPKFPHNKGVCSVYKGVQMSRLVDMEWREDRHRNQIIRDALSLEKAFALSRSRPNFFF